MVLLQDARLRGLLLRSVESTVRDQLLEISLQKSSAGFEPNFTCEIRNWLAGAQDLNFYLLSQSGLCAAGENFALSGV